MDAADPRQCSTPQTKVYRGVHVGDQGVAGIVPGCAGNLTAETLPVEENGHLRARRAFIASNLASSMEEGDGPLSATTGHSIRKRARLSIGGNRPITDRVIPI